MRGSTAMPAGAFTIEFTFWIRFGQDTDGGGMVMSQGVVGGKRRMSVLMNDHRFEMQILHPDDTSSVVTNNTSVADATYFTYFHHVAITFNGDREVRFYLDGQPDGVRTLSKSGMMAYDATLYLGGHEYGEGLLRGTLGPFALSNVARTDFTYGRFGLVTNEPTATVGAPVAPPITGTVDLVVMGVRTYPNADGGEAGRGDGAEPGDAQHPERLLHGPVPRPCPHRGRGLQRQRPHLGGEPHRRWSDCNTDRQPAWSLRPSGCTPQCSDDCPGA